LGPLDPSIFSTLLSMRPATQPAPLSESVTVPPIWARTAMPSFLTRAKEALSFAPGPPLKRSPSHGWPPISRSLPPPDRVSGEPSSPA
jgi:hypothetical protein